MHRAREVDEIAQIVRELQARSRGVAGPFCSAPETYTAWYHRHKWEWWKHEAGKGVNVCKQYGDDGVLQAKGGGGGAPPLAEEPEEEALQPWLEEGLFS